MKKADVIQLELEAIRKMFELGAVEVCPELKKMFAAHHGVMTPDPSSSSLSHPSNRV